MHDAAIRVIPLSLSTMRGEFAAHWLAQTSFQVGTAAEGALDENAVGILLLQASDRTADIDRLLDTWPRGRVLVALLCPCASCMHLVGALQLMSVFCADEPPAQLVQAIRAVANGSTYASPSFAAFTEQQRPFVNHQLTPREVEVLRLIAEGQSKKQIAEQLHLSVKTIDNHCTSMMAKLDLHDRVALARYAIRRGFVAL